jgi:predicted acyltransferase
MAWGGGFGDDGGMGTEARIGMRKPGRVLSVDMLRGMTIALMILVNDPGDWGHVFSQLDHAPWNGWTLTDLVFPTFLFLVGASIVFSMQARMAKGDCRKTQTGHIFIRFLKLAVLAWALNYFPRMHWTMRIYGVLMRIALCYLVGALIVLAVSNLREAWRAKVLAGVVAAILVGYWALMRFVKVPGAGHPEVDFPLLDPMWNLAAYVDRGVSGWMMAHLHTGRLYQKTRDPEGLLSTLPAVGSVLVGALIGMWMRRPEWKKADERNGMRAAMLAMGGLLFLSGAVWGRWFPVNKNLWTSSFVLLAAGIGTMLLALLSWLVDYREQPWPEWLRVVTWPWFVFGSNAIAAFTISVVIVKTLIDVKHVDAAGKVRSMWWYAYYDVFARHGSNDWTSLAFAVTFVVVCFLPVWALWQKKIFLKM